MNKEYRKGIVKSKHQWEKRTECKDMCKSPQTEIQKWKDKKIIIIRLATTRYSSMLWLLPSHLIKCIIGTQETALDNRQPFQLPHSLTRETLNIIFVIQPPCSTALLYRRCLTPFRYPRRSRLFRCIQHDSLLRYP